MFIIMEFISHIYLKEIIQINFEINIYKKKENIKKV